MRRLVVPVLLALAASLALAVSANAATFIQALGHKDTYFNHFGDPAKGRVHAYAEGQEFDTGLRGKSAMIEVRKVRRVAIYDVELQVLHNGVFVPVAHNPSDVNSSDVQPALARQWTPLVEWCPTSHLARTYRVRSLDGIRWDDGTFSSRTHYSRWFGDRILASDPLCPPPTPTPAAQLAASITDTPDPVLNGETLTYTVHAANTGNATANGATMIIDTDDRLNNLHVTAPAGVTCTVTNDIEPGTPELDEGVLCDLGSLSSGENVTVVVTGTTTEPASGGADAYDTIAVVSTTNPGVADAEATARTTVLAAADLSLTKTATPTPSTTDPANLYRFTFTATNLGPNTATGVTVADPWPSHLADPTAVQAGCTFDDTADTLTCDAGSLTASGAGATKAFVVEAPILGAGTNTATVDGDQGDPDLTNNTDSATIAA
jgi:uncharacterized repeat protein (TIGR01451 family)